MTVIALNRYYEQYRDTEYVRSEFAKLHTCMTWYISQFGNGLIREWTQCEWADGVMKTGNTLYTNVLYLKALRDMRSLSRVMKNSKYESLYKKQYSVILRQLNIHLWNGNYFADWKDYKRHDYFATHQNYLAVVFGIPNKKQADSIVSYAQNQVKREFTYVTNVPKYPIWRIPFSHILIGMRDYHNQGCLWLQPGIMYAIALSKTGRIRQSLIVLESIAKKICQYGHVYEVYEKNGEPVNRIAYKSEGPFAWSAGLFLWAIHEVT